MAHFLIVSSRYYAPIAAELEAGAQAVMRAEGASFEVVEALGALEISPIIRFALQAKKYDGFVALGCIIRGETTHYETVCEESARGLTWLAMEHQACIGNGILTLESEDQADARGDKGAFAARAALQLVRMKEKFT